MVNSSAKSDSRKSTSSIVIRKITPNTETHVKTKKDKLTENSKLIKKLIDDSKKNIYERQEIVLDGKTVRRSVIYRFFESQLIFNYKPCRVTEKKSGIKHEFVCLICGNSYMHYFFESNNLQSI